MKLCIREHVATWCDNYITLPDDVDIEKLIQEIKESPDDWVDTATAYKASFDDVFYSDYSELVNGELIVENDEEEVLLST